MIRRATRDDLDAVHRLYAAWVHSDESWGQTVPSRAAIEPWFDHHLFVAEHEGEMVGFVCGVVKKTPPLAVVPTGEPYLEIEEIYVRPDVRGHDYGGQLLDKARESARADGVERIYAFAGAKNQAAITRVSERHGLRRWGTQFFA